MLRWLGSVWLDSVWLGLVRFGLVWFVAARFVFVSLVFVFLKSSVRFLVLVGSCRFERWNGAKGVGMG